MIERSTKESYHNKGRRLIITVRATYKYLRQLHVHGGALFTAVVKHTFCHQC